MEKEIWETVKEEMLDGTYEVSTYGRLRRKEVQEYFTSRWGTRTKRIKPARFIKTRLDRGYETVALRDSNGIGRTFQVHRLVAKTFIPNPDNKPFVDHINTIRDDNRVENLRWCTSHENQLNPLTRKHLSAAMVGNVRTKGKVFTDEHRRKISEANIGRRHSEETIEKIRKSLTGRKLSEAEKEKRSKKVAQYTKDGELIKIWPSASSAEKQLGVTWANIMKCANPKSKNKTAGGYVWMFVE